MSWAEFSGSTISVSDNIAGTAEAEPSSGFSGVGAYATGTGFNADGSASSIANTSGFQLVPTVGSIVVLNFAEVIQLTEGRLGLSTYK